MSSSGTGSILWTYRLPCKTTDSHWKCSGRGWNLTFFQVQFSNNFDLGFASANPNWTTYKLQCSL